ncbi:MAG: metallophosphoesterase [Candidatus Latescibacterota bacterium]
MKIAYSSDLHMDVTDHHPPIVERIAGIMCEADPDVLVLAGDVGNTLTTMEAVFKLFAGIEATKLFVPGNHDLWVESDKDFGKGSDSGEKYASLVPALCERMGFVDLGQGPFYFDDTAFVGSAGWYDYSFADPRLGLGETDYVRGSFAEELWWDSRMISWCRFPHSPHDKGLSDGEICGGLVKKLESHITEAEKHVERIVAVIHTCPFVELFSRSDPPYYLDAYTGSSKIGDVLRRHNKVKICINGHKHQCGDWEIDGIRVHRRVLGAVFPEDSVEERARDAVGIIEL